ncbi:MAG: thiopeptide-type bacteriocin biosynthesis protein [Dehalococcoidia bacterium]
MTTDWHHCTVEFTDPAAAERVAATDLGPALTTAQDSGLLHGWWYTRKRRDWRLRYHAERPAVVTDLLDNLAAAGRIIGWAPGVYEPETVAFGGDAAMGIAHELFCHDSRHLLLHIGEPASPSLGRRETSTVLCSVLLRGAGLDWYEQGDVWAKVAELRPNGPSTTALPPERARVLAQAMRRLMTVDARALCAPASGALTGQDRWVAAFENAGQALAELARQGRLRRGLRAILAHHVIFHANRAGLSLAHQSTLAALALNNVFADSDDPVSLPTNTEET